MVSPGSERFHYLLACVTAAMLFGTVSGHFRVGRELYVWHQQPCLCQRNPFQKLVSSRISPEWFQRHDGDESTKPEETNDERRYVGGLMKQLKTNCSQTCIKRPS